ncbi:hypothetical protein BJ085DRAFT_32147 [Dimargaris cristalligena]|uniref:G-protein coupled receptors family 1 profile domain-containing protein n=1 Tax=Dimargaris cristalligena TaxID=215637 RepID=A0A4P9ZQE7_9FUNG|nr:hypothetical protein BJ085DRAFT_32147 [Dimargaris cristalligena]|eukprot:RKP35704.1 hypothetical protein BJ085DRAFT_32147 [Dimargaris cristalligena]
MNYYALYVANYTLASLSVLCSLISIAIILWVWYKKPSTKESPSFSLAIWISFTDIPLRIVDYLTNPLTFGRDFPNSPVYARFLWWLNMFSIMWFVYLNVMIALDLQLVIFHRLPRQARIRRMYPYMATGVAFFFSFWYLILPDVRFLADGSVTTSVPQSLAVYFSMYWLTAWLLVAILYVTTVVVAIFITLYRSQARLKEFALINASRSRSRNLINNARLIVAYPVIMFFLFVPYSSINLVNLVRSNVPRTLMDMCLITFSLQGILNFVTLLFHPVMLAAYKENLFNLPAFLRPIPVERKRRGKGKPTAFSGLPTLGALPTSKKAKVTHLHSLDMGPGVTGHFNVVMESSQMSVTECDTDSMNSYFGTPPAQHSDSDSFHEETTYL